MRFLSLGQCAVMWSSLVYRCVVLVTDVDTVTVMRVLLNVCMLRDWECVRVTAMLVLDGVVGMSAGHEYVGGTGGSGIVANATNVLGMSVVRGKKGVGEMCMCLARGGVWKRLCLGFINPVGTGRVLDVCLCLDCGRVGGE